MHSSLLQQVLIARPTPTFKKQEELRSQTCVPECCLVNRKGEKTQSKEVAREILSFILSPVRSGAAPLYVKSSGGDTAKCFTWSLICFLCLCSHPSSEVTHCPFTARQSPPCFLEPQPLETLDTQIHPSFETPGSVSEIPPWCPDIVW